MIGLVYVLKNAATPGIHKVGFTTRTTSVRISELNSQTGTIGLFTLVEEFEVPANLADVVEQYAHKVLTTDGKHFSKEYFAATSVECRDAILKAIAATGANDRLAKLREREAQRVEDQAAQQERTRQMRIERAEAQFRTFLVDSARERRNIIQLAKQVDAQSAEVESFGFWKKRFSSRGRGVEAELQKGRLEVRLAVNSYYHELQRFKRENYVPREVILDQSLQIDEYQVHQLLDKWELYRLRGFDLLA
jgi:hypothetical protein